MEIIGTSACMETFQDRLPHNSLVHTQPVPVHSISGTRS